MPRHQKKIIDGWSAIMLISLIVLDGMVWKNIIVADAGAHGRSPRLYFLDVKQGESALAIFPPDIKIMTDAGSDDGVVQELQKIMPPDDNYIDLAIISYPQDADYAGYGYLLDHYTVGAFIYDGRNDDVDSNDWRALVSKIDARHIPLITLGAGDSIRYGSGNNNNDEIAILSPDKELVQSAEPSDAAIVQHIVTPEFRALLASDGGVNVEAFLLAEHDDLRANILKAPFPGSGIAGGDDFFHAVAPNVVVITPGIKNSPSEPSKIMLGRLASSTASIKASVLDIETSGTTEIDSIRGEFLLYNK